MSEKDIGEFRREFRISMIERLVIKTAFGVPVLAGGAPAQQSGDALKEWLDLNSQKADEAYGAHFHDPALSALYADEAKEVIEDMKKIVDGLVSEMKRKGWA